MERIKIEQLNAALRKTSRLNRMLQMKCYQSSGDLRMLRIISHHSDEGLTPSILASKLEIALPTVSRKLSVLEKQELIERKPSATDRRKTFVFATEKGKELLREDYLQFITAFSAASEKIGESKVKQLYLLLEEFSACLEQEIQKEAGDDA
ncbi:MAG: MarR family transcriptional regulator [Oscillospiraceae bacterium]|nr:MarR family transcriptional regulator [Oscillospiraceae bacterium]